MSDDHDPVNPPHYKTSAGFEVIDVIEAFDLDFCLGNAVKYICRHKKKGGVEDLAKARWYIDRAIHERKTKITAEDLKTFMQSEKEQPRYQPAAGAPGFASVPMATEGLFPLTDAPRGRVRVVDGPYAGRTGALSAGDRLYLDSPTTDGWFLVDVPPKTIVRVPAGERSPLPPDAAPQQEPMAALAGTKLFRSDELSWGQRVLVTSGLYGGRTGTIGVKAPLAQWAPIHLDGGRVINGDATVALAVLGVDDPRSPVCPRCRLVAEHLGPCLA